MLEEKVELNELKKPHHAKKRHTPVWELVLVALSKNAYSISSLARVVGEADIGVHRLFLKGYLACMTDLNLVRSAYMGNSKIHFLQPPDFLKYKHNFEEKKADFAKARDSKGTDEEMARTLRLLIHKGIEDDCPQCGGPMIHQEGVHKCLLCGECVEC